MKKAIDIKGLTSEVFSKRINTMKKETAEFSKEVGSLHVYISEGNSKTGKAVPSVSLRPCIDCGNCKACSKLCYDMRRDMYPNVMKTRARNAAIWQNDSKRYFDEISEFCKTEVAFRWHVGGDIVNSEYLEGMVRVANENQHCKFLVFTKMFSLVNKYLEDHEKPANLQIIFSGWVGQEMNNPHGLPTSHPIMANGDTSAEEGNVFFCKGNCTECLKHNEGCWTLKKREQVVFMAH